MFKFDYKDGYWYDYTTLSNGQTAGMLLDKYDTDKVVYYYVCFGIANKKKHLKRWLFQTEENNVDDNVTGKCGTEGLLWAFERLKFFGEMEVIQDKKREVRIVVQGSDSRRFRIYQHFLKRLGYTKRWEQEYGWCLVKILNKQK